MNKNYELGSEIIMKKSHACKSNLWIIKRMGVDIKIECKNCGRTIMMDKLDFDKKLKKVVS